MCDILFKTTLDDVSDEQLKGFCVGWKNPIGKRQLRVILENSYTFVLAIHEKSGEVIGFVNALSDGEYFAFIPMLEVKPEYQNKGIGKQLLNILFEKLNNIPIIDLICDNEVQTYYEKLGMIRMHGMRKQNK